MPPYRGDEGVRRFLNEWLEVWDEYEVGVDEILAAPDGRIVSLAWQRGKGRRSGLPMEMEWAQITTMRDGKIIQMDNYDRRSQALEAAGLSD
jgi:ketosteroid isomerase-like protein